MEQDTKLQKAIIETYKSGKKKAGKKVKQVTKPKPKGKY